MKLTLLQARELVGRRIKECASFDTSRLDNIIYLANYAAWRSGQWYGCQRYIDVLNADGRIVLPPDYGTLLGLNINGIPQRLHSDWYQFSPNGPGSMKCCPEDCEIRGEVFDLMEVPTVFKVRQEKIFVLAKSYHDNGKVVCVQGVNSDGNSISNIQTTILGTERTVASGPGELFTLNAGSFIKSFMTFRPDGITSITKPPTVGPVEIYADRAEGAAFLVRLEPWQTTSDLRAYRLPHPCCNYRCLQALVKKAEPPFYSNDDDIILIENPEALILMVLHKYHEMETKELNYASYFFARAIESLNGQLKEKSGGIIRSIKVHGLGYARNSRHSPYVQ